ncbi:amidohydrolase [Amycolatopsis jejuensis]|uniref:amidohydrolase n=1 Tax=Amycolatopsis jejuensis TaxID=330084 RepID=UPI00068ED855|nr:amidohydrolase [Amycolatopsis jejuensis]
MSADQKDRAAGRVRHGSSDAVRLSHALHARPEIGYEEADASRWLAEALAAEGYSVEAGICGLPTAFRAQLGSGSLNVALVAEYDALPGIGHACGHNMIAAAAYAAARALGPVADELDLTITVLGTPAEEVLSRGGKILMLERGGFDGVHAALMIHPTPFEAVSPAMIAASTMDVAVTGQAAHASAAPQRGRNAADGLAIGQIAIGLLRQHIDPGIRISGITTAAGEVPNIIPASARAEYVLRAPTLAALSDVRTRVTDCFRGGALAAGCQVELRGGERPYAEFRADPELAELYRANAVTAGREFDPEEQVAGFLASTDAGNVSQAIPMLHPFVGLGTWPVVNHQPDFTRACATPAADDAMLAGASLLAATIVDLADRPSVRSRLLAGASMSGAGA